MSACARLSQSPLPSTLSNGAAPMRPANGAWLCGSTPSTQSRTNAIETLAGYGYKNIYRFKATPDGGSPYGALLGLNGKLYGTTYAGGKNGYGAIFETSPAGQERVLYSFKPGTDGAYPCAGLVAVGGKLYGTAAQGGAKGWGTIYQVSTSGQER